MNEPSTVRRTPPAIEVVLATRGRPAGAVRAARSILRSGDPALRLQLVDQSDDADCATVLEGLGGDRRVAITAAPPRGLAAARNLGIRLTSAPIVAFTDDDCEVEPNWLDAIGEAFARDPRIGVVFGAVRPTAHDRTAGFIPAYPLERPFTARNLAEKPRAEGIGACMAVRRSTWEMLGGFDELFGSGAPFRAAEESDFVIRALAAKQWVHETPDAFVIHHGFRTWQDAPRLIEGYMFGLGGANAKLLRLGGVQSIRPLAALGWRWLAGEPVVDLGYRPPRASRLDAFLRGARWGLTLPLDSSTRCFRPPAGWNRRPG